jgi:hypothetical protein
MRFSAKSMLAFDTGDGSNLLPLMAAGMEKK